MLFKGFSILNLTSFFTGISASLTVALTDFRKTVDF
jgi:hypothetical protein